VAFEAVVKGENWRSRTADLDGKLVKLDLASGLKRRRFAAKSDGYL